MKAARVRLANILISAGFDQMRVVQLLQIPLAVEVNVEASAVDKHEVNLVYNQEKRVKIKTPGRSFSPQTPLTPNLDHVESIVVNDGTGDWSMSRSKLIIKYSDGYFASVYFGAKSSGPQTDPERPLIHRATIPPSKGWPPLKTENPQYPIAPN